MILRYHKGQNFGDALNPMIFEKFLPDFFDNDDSETFVGIGSLLGFNLGRKKKYIFSSGFAAGQESTYGKPPVIDDTFDILCVRGPLTAKALNIDPKLAVTDGAALLSFFDFKPQKKIHEISFMPHVGSEDFYDLKTLVESIGINYISPRGSIDSTINNILSSEVLITEAMHGAIVADTLRVPWIPIKAYKTINDYKWQDWCKSLKIEYIPKVLPSVFNRDMSKAIIDNKFNGIPFFAKKILGTAYDSLINERNKNQLLSQLIKIKNTKPYLSSESILKSKSEQLLSILMSFKTSRL